jgi:hypothetical protein
LQIIVHYKKFDLLTHPLCELFLHLKWLRGRWISWIAMIQSLIFTTLVTALALLQYGQMDYLLGKYNCSTSDNEWGNHKDRPFSCFTVYLVYPVLIISAISIVITAAKIYQERKSCLQSRMWQHRPEDIFQVVVVILVVINVFVSKQIWNLVGYFSKCKILCVRLCHSAVWF